MRWHLPSPRAWPALGVACLLAGGVGAGRGSGPLFVLGITAVGLGLARVGLRRLPVFMLPLVVGLGWISGQVSVGREQALLTAILPLEVETLTVVAMTDAAPSSFGGSWFIGRPVGLATGGRETRWRGPNLLVRLEADQEVSWSELWRIRGQLQTRPGTAGGHFYAGVVDATDFEVLSDHSTPLIGAGNAIRRRVLDQLDGGRPGEALLAGFLVGDISDLSQPDQVAMRRAGISHFVAVSGANVAGFLLLWWLLLGPIGVGARRRGWVGLVGLAVFLIATRWEPSVVRAGLMAAVVFAGRAAGLAIDAWTALGAGTALSLLAAPALVSDLGFQLSVAATAGIMVGYDLLPSSLPDLVRKPLGVTIGAQAAVTPLLLAQGEGIPLLSPVTNLISAPLVATATLFGVGGVITGPGPLLWVAVSASDLVLLIARVAAWFPQLGVGALVLIAAAICVTIRWSPIRPLMAALASTVLVVMIVPRGVVGPAVIFLDVGQGDAALLVSAGGEAVLIDGGPDPRQLWQALYEYRIRQLRLVVATHPHDDHIAGLVGLAGRLSIGEVWQAGDRHANSTWAKIAAEMEAAAVPVMTPGVGTRLVLSGMSLEVLGPERRYDSANDQSIVIVARSATASLLMTGDVEVAAQRDLDSIDVDILKVPHHGGNTSVPTWLMSTSPAIAVISVGPNRFGHPAPEVIEAMEAAGARVITTQDEGDVFLPLDRADAWPGRARARVRASARCRRRDKWRRPGELQPTRPRSSSRAFPGFHWRSERPRDRSQAERVLSGDARPAEHERRDRNYGWPVRVAVRGPGGESFACASAAIATSVRKRRPRQPRRPSDIDLLVLSRCRSFRSSTAHFRLRFRRRCRRATRTCPGRS
ncbi:MAG: ComEC/Rec2 family competence protein [Acidimicrobiia bacterium]